MKSAFLLTLVCCLLNTKAIAQKMEWVEFKLTGEFLVEMPADPDSAEMFSVPITTR